MVHDQMRLCVQITLSDIFYFFFILGKKEDKEEHLKAKNNM